MQTRKHSFIESCVNIAIGYSIALLSQILIFPLYGMDVSLDTNIKIGLLFTGISLVRSYVIRRWANNGGLHRFSDWISRCVRVGI